MATKNELIVAIDAARARGVGVKSIRNQKYDPSNFYMTCTDGKQVGPIKCEGDKNELNRKFGEAQSYVAGTKKLAAPQGTKTAA
jgi:hypothetical protein